jgi:hypothetical protein
MSFKIICSSSLDKLHEFDEFAKKILRIFIASHNFCGQSKRDVPPLSKDG